MPEFLPGPTETEDQFKKRVLYCQKLLENPPEELKPCTKLQPKDLKKIQNLYSISPSWLPLFISKSGLAPWHGGSLWIFQETLSSPWGAALQLRTTKPWFYSREEIITHELAHAGRMMYHEPKYEEFLAYQTSSSKFRKLFGPIVTSSGEALMVMVLILFTVFIEVLSLDSYWGILSLVKLIPIAFIVAGFLRLGLRHKNYHRCLKNLENFIPKGQALAFIYRLTDDEIDYMGTLSQSSLKDYMKSQSSFRWKLIKEHFQC